MSHQYLSVSQTQPGMVLADAVLDKRGHVLLPAGVTLTENMLRSLAQHQISLLSVKTAEISEQEQQEVESKHLERLAHIARKGPYPEPTQTLIEYLQRFRKVHPS